jgi:hypothetical protein
MTQHRCICSKKKKNVAKSAVMQMMVITHINFHFARFEVPTDMMIKMLVVRDMTLFGLVCGYQHFGRDSCLKLQGGLGMIFD